MQLHRRQRFAWISAAFSCCAALGAGETDPWTALALAAIPAALLTLGSGETPLPRVPAQICAGWCALMTGFCAALGARAFPALPESPAIALTILGQSWASLRKKTAVAARTCAILAAFLLGFYALVIGFGLEASSTRDLALRGAEPDALALYSLPLSALLLPRGGGQAKRLPWLLASLTLAFLCALVASRAGSLYEATETIRVFSVMERFEGLLSMAIAVGAFCLCSLAAAGSSALYRGSSVGEVLFWTLAASGIGLSQRLDPVLVLTGNLLFCGAVPLLTRIVEKRKNLKKGA